MPRGRALLWLFLGLLAVPASGREDATSLLGRAEEILAREPAQALELATAALALEPGSARGHGLAGRAAAQAGRPELAVEHLGRALQLGQEDLRLRLYFASALWETARYDEAEAAFREACRAAGTGSRGAVAWHQLGRFLLWLGRSAEALEPLEHAASLTPLSPDVALDFARALDLEHDPRTPAAFARAVELAPQSPRARWGLGQSLIAAGRREEGTAALTVYEDLYRREQETVRAEGLARAALDQAWALLRAGDATAARNAFARIGDGAEALEGLASAESALGRHSEAVLILERALRRFPGHETLVRLRDRERLAAFEKEL